LKKRASELPWALARYQTHEHPRGSYSYEEDMLSVDRISDLLPTLRNGFKQHFPINQACAPTLSFTVLGILGDTVLFSAAWLAGSELNGMDVYDTVLIIIEVSGNKFAIPAARVLSGTSLQVIFAKLQMDPERAMHKTLRSTKGLSNARTGITWYYWIPCSDGRWLFAQSQDMKFLGRREAQVVTDEEATARLLKPDMNVSLTSVEDIKNTLQYSRKAVEYLFNFI
jgi:hypothetical protein